MKALSIKQPWAWLIVNGFKDIENRDWPTRFTGRILVHTGKTMTRSDYSACALFCSAMEGPPLPFPKFDELPLGGIVGEVRIAGCVRDHPSPWFCGPFGFMLDNARPLPFQPVKGALGFFEVAETLGHPELLCQRS